jgi:hypothetical protein
MACNLRCWKAISLIFIGYCVFLTGCNGSDTIWSGEAQSPDGRWLAAAETVETSGFGTGDITTVVTLKWVKGSDKPENILVFAHDGSSATKTIHLCMYWVTPSHLEVTYDGQPRVDFQVVKDGDVEISVREISTKIDESQTWPCSTPPKSQ